MGDLTNIVARSANLAGHSSAAGVANATAPTFTALSGSVVNYIVFYAYNVSDAAAPLIAYIDTATGLPVTPSGGDLILTFDAGANKIFKL